MLIGLTGSFGSGKTTIAEMFRKNGALVIDADAVYVSLIEPGKKLYKKIVTEFGRGITDARGCIDRRALSRIVFNDRAALRNLDRITHPEIIKEIKKAVKSYKGRSPIIIDSALIIESGFHAGLDKIIMVKIRQDVRLKRLMRAKKMSKSAILLRVDSQMPDKKKLAFADYIIDNSGSKTKTQTQVDKIWKNLGE